MYPKPAKLKPSLFCKLPCELIQRSVLPRLDRQALLSCDLTCTGLRRLTLPIKWKHLCICVDAYETWVDKTDRDTIFIDKKHLRTFCIDLYSGNLSLQLTNVRHLVLGFDWYQERGSVVSMAGFGACGWGSLYYSLFMALPQRLARLASLEVHTVMTRPHDTPMMERLLIQVSTSVEISMHIVVVGGGSKVRPRKLPLNLSNLAISLKADLLEFEDVFDISQGLRKLTLRLNDHSRISKVALKRLFCRVKKLDYLKICANDENLPTDWTWMPESVNTLELDGDIHGIYGRNKVTVNCESLVYRGDTCAAPIHAPHAKWATFVSTPECEPYLETPMWQIEGVSLHGLSQQAVSNILRMTRPRGVVVFDPLLRFPVALDTLVVVQTGRVTSTVVVDLLMQNLELKMLTMVSPYDTTITGMAKSYRNGQVVYTTTHDQFYNVSESLDTLESYEMVDLSKAI